MDDRVCMHYVLERLEDIKTQSDLDEFKDEIKHNLKVNEDYRNNPNKISDLPFETEPFETEPFQDFDVYSAIDKVKRDYIERALSQSKNIGEASKMLGVKNYQTMQNWMDKLGMDK